MKSWQATSYLVLLCIPLLLTSNSIAEEQLYARQGNTLGTLRKSNTVSTPSDGLLFYPVLFGDSTPVTLIAPTEWRSLIKQTELSLIRTHKKFESLFGKLPPINTRLRLMPEAEFFKKTNAPPWTNAMYYHGEILIPIANPAAVDLENLFRSIRHEYTHAVIHSLSAGRCPGWLDEGIAQWAEGSENPALEPALRSWLTKNPPVSLAKLQAGFTRLENSMVPAAYAQSLFATTTLIQAYGFRTMRTYLDTLRSGTAKPIAFKSSFRMHEDNFETALAEKMKKWRSQKNKIVYTGTYR